MSLSLADLNTTIRNLVRTLLAMPDGSIRPANQNMPTGKLVDASGNANQFATVFLDNAVGFGWDDNTWQSTDPAPGQDTPPTVVQQTISGTRQVSANIQFFRGDAYTKATRLRTLLQSADAILAMQKSGIGIARIGQAQNLTTAVDQYYEERGLLQVDFYCVSTETANVESYGTFPVTIQTNDTEISTEVTTQ